MESLGQLPAIQLQRDPIKGRSLHVVAPDGLRAGTVLFQEQAFASVVLSAFKGAVCAVCLKDADPDICCDDCSQVTFCSDVCQAALDDVHQLECATLEDIDLFAKKSSADKDLLRLLARTLCRRVSPSSSSSSPPSTTVVPTFAQVDAMVHAASQLAPEWLACVRHGATLLLASLPSACRVSVDDVVELAARINENSYSLDAWTSVPHPAVCVGLFPLAALLNHSCAPNCIWAHGGDGRMEVRTTRFVPAGDELCFSYIDTHVPRVSRQATLRATKHFDCRCRRCADPWSATAMDSLLDGVCCGVCDSLMQPDVGGRRCVRCESSFADDSTIDELTTAAQRQLQHAHALVAKRQYADAKATLLAKLEAPPSLFRLHESHHVSTSSLQLLGDCEFKLGQFQVCVDHRQDLVARLRCTTDAVSLAMAAAHADVGEVLDSGLRRHVWSDVDAKHAARQSHFDASRAIRQVCLPSNHPAVLRGATALG
ncbi:Aste57867_18144 [Aphanomyces stellatus]|uniref:Aste57867_18144 protein n=1 Tax=Aphanomyces stellatus TaxID=120398 RepID=A0A485L9N4_9STRA|nr:hypothetical protein As57867_018082 [Aphanomyces stellatus]VFT94882.1 Aste57867_18144 [Aphanomyces stellatus]